MKEKQTKKPTQNSNMKDRDINKQNKIWTWRKQTLQEDF